MFGRSPLDVNVSSSVKVVNIFYGKRDCLKLNRMVQVYLHHKSPWRMLLVSLELFRVEPVRPLRCF